MIYNILNNLSVNIPGKILDDFLKEEIRSGYTVSSKIKEVWLCEIDLVLELLRVCEKYNLKCWLDAGSLLGAIRHKGFIPWDDDIDMCMFREDYDILVQVAAKEFKNPYLFQTAYTDKNYIRGHAQMRNVHTTAILKGDIYQQFNQGIFIDIFVLDGVSNNPQYLSGQKRELFFLKKLMSTTFYGKISVKRPFHLFPIIISKWLFGYNNRYMKLFERYENILRSVNIENVEYIAPLGFKFDTNKRIRNKHIYDETVMLDFEFIHLPAPAGYHEFLTNRYGNYMQQKQLPTTHGAVIFDTEKPHKEVLKELRKS
jgi:phosphorylcholine metabolism protein LicD